jgi:hypothetical protein
MGKATITHLGCVGHFICASDCQFRRHTQVDGPGGHFRVSTVGDFYYKHEKNGKRQTLGAGADSFFETMVFETTSKPADGDRNEGCGCHEVVEFCEIDSERYATAGAAQAGHEKFVAMFAKRVAAKPAGGA